MCSEPLGDTPRLRGPLCGRRRLLVVLTEASDLCPPDEESDAETCEIGEQGGLLSPAGADC